MKSYWLVMVFTMILGIGLAGVACSGDDDDDHDDDDDEGNDDTWPTWVDSSSGLTWEVEPANKNVNWEEAVSYCEELDLAGGGWRLPTISELRSLIRGCETTKLGGSCRVTDECTSQECYEADACKRCGYLDGPAAGGAYWPDEIAGEIVWYWSVSVEDEDKASAWRISFDNGEIDGNGKEAGSSVNARCVR